MKILFIYNEHDYSEVQALDKVKEEFEHQIEIIKLSEAGALKSLVRTTPFFIPITEQMQGKHLLEETAINSGKLYVSALANEYQEKEDSFLREEETNRLDAFIKKEINKGIDDFTESLLEGGIV